MTTKEKRDYIILGVVLVALFGFLYINFFNKPKPAVLSSQLPAGTLPGSTPPLPGTLPTTATSTALPTTGGQGAMGAMGGMGAAAAPVSTSGFLPHGTEFNFKIFEDPRFQSLAVPVYPTVDRSEVGQSNPFAGGNTATAASPTNTGTTPTNTKK